MIGDARRSVPCRTNDATSRSPSSLTTASSGGNFGGKDELIVAALREAAARDEQRYRDALDAAGSDPRSRIRAMFEAARRFAEQPGYRGCRYTAAYMSLPEGHPAHQVAREHKRAVRALLRAELTGLPDIDPDAGATQLAMLLDAVDVSAVLRPEAGAATAVLPLLDAILAAPEQSANVRRPTPSTLGGCPSRAASVADVIDPVVSSAPAGAVLADVRWYLDGRSGREAYEAGHLPGAVFVDLDRHLAGPASPEVGRHPLPSAEGFAASMSELGIGADDVVVAYDDAGGVVAARLVWMLRVLGVEAALLDGGIAAYEGPLETEPVERPRADFPVREWPAERLADIDAAAAGPLVVDARDGERFRGETEPVDPRPGHIPGARSLPTRGHLGADGRFLPADELRERFAAVGVDSPTDELIAYCGSGVTASHTLLTLEHAGLGQGRLYSGSWSQYSATDRPAATGPE